MFHVDSEAGHLKQAILHRPGLELKRLSPTNHDEFLFDDVLWVKRAKEEHDAFAETLREALVTHDRKTVYRVDDGIPVLLVEDGIATAQVDGFPRQ